MTTLKNHRLHFAIILLALFAFKFSTKDPWQSKLLSIQEDGSLVYHPDEKGNTIPDFSLVGYHHSDKEIPSVKVVKTISPNGTDDQKIIQDAIDEVSALNPDASGLRGAILLKKGTWKIPESIFIKTGGIVLRGEGDTESGTKILATGKGQRSLFKISGSGKPLPIESSRTKLFEDFVPTGSFSVKVENASAFRPGDQIILYYPGSQNWITDLKMDQIVERQGTRQWKPEEYNLGFQREITGIKGNEVFFDNPVVMEINPKYTQASLFKYKFEGRIREVGIENMYFESEFQDDKDEDHGWIAIDYNAIENGWIRNITARHFGYAAVSLGDQAKNITVMDAVCLDPKSIVTGGRRYSFNNNGQLNLFMRMKTTYGRHDFVTGAKVLGPNVFLDGLASHSQSDIGPHHRWSAGTLYDNIITDGDIDIQDRGNWGSGHGWSGVTQILWNCQAKKAAVQSPWVSGFNYAIGLQGQKYEGRFSGRNDGIWEGLNKPGLNPASLYKAQLAFRKKK
ncbi:hypothetical protein [Pedobacter nutrimenti]|uniref:Pectate lyase-like protein n=1 Tax=Pedobacter nutrimenti TaxID=1241337 RepID=A0A318UPW9_9SPHI|nr:hypothetical protein [Pedobacter nutrimenti]PYF72758.1 hypothetical protein B0O44_105128 [Pedobacter nutrimenti]